MALPAFPDEMLNTDLASSPPFTYSDRSILAAWFRVLGAVENVTKTKSADTGRYTYHYADLGDVLDECERASELHGLRPCQMPWTDGDRMYVVTVLFDENGEWLAFPPNGMVLPKEAQAYGSALTYLRRYTALTLFGISPEDDDGRAATISAQASPGRRTEAERLIRESMGQMTPYEKHHFAADFKSEFGMTLADLPAGRHGDALTWARQWQPPEQPPAEDHGLEAPGGDAT